MLRQNPFYYNLPTRPEDFVGRWALVDEIVTDLCHPYPDSWAVIGGRRFGKSSLLRAIEASLIERLDECEEADRLVFPLLVDLKRCKPESEEHIYACILHYLDRAFRRSPAWIADFAVTDLRAVVTANYETISFFQFENVLENLIQQVDDCQRPLRLVLLLDEVESVTDFDWSETLFNQLRAMIYDGPLARMVKLVLTGSASVIRARQTGSPLLNAVQIRHLTLLTEADLQSLIARGGELPANVADIVEAQSGGHPFIAQYLLHHTWDGGLAHTKLHTVERVSYQMRQRRNADLEGWWQAIGNSGRWAYAVLTMAEGWVDEREMLERIQRTDQSLDEALSALCYHGLVKRGESLRHYRIAGKLFADWFVLNGAKLLVEAESQPEVSQIIIEHLEQHIGAQTNITGDAKGPLASGQFESASTVGGGEASDQRSEMTDES